MNDPKITPNAAGPADALPVPTMNDPKITAAGPADAPTEPHIIHGNCVDGMAGLPDNSVDAVIADPPYDIGKDFGNNSTKLSKEDYCKWCQEWIDESVRVLKPNGTLFIYGFAEFLSYVQVLCCSEWNCRYLQWHYINKVSPAAKFWQRTHESVLMVWKCDGFPTFDRDAVRVPYTETFLKNAAGKKRKIGKGRFEGSGKQTVYKAHKGGALPRDVIKCSALSGGAGKKERVSWHPTQKPLGITRTLIKSIGIKDDTLIVIPFAGSGTEALACKELGVDFVAWDLNEEYVEKANQRLSEM